MAKEDVMVVALVAVSLLAMLLPIYAAVVWAVCNVVLAGVFGLIDPLTFWEILVVGFVFACIHQLFGARAGAARD